MNNRQSSPASFFRSEPNSHAQSPLFPSSSLPRFPATRYQGSKRKVLANLANAFSGLEFTSALDLYSGSGTVSLLLRLLGKRVTSNDYQLFNQVAARVFLNATASAIKSLEYDLELRNLLENWQPDFLRLVSTNYRNVFFTDEENQQIDAFCQNVARLPSMVRDTYSYAIGQALMKKRPYNLFHRANLDMRTRDVKRSFGNAATWETSILRHAVAAIRELKEFPFDNLPIGQSLCVNTISIDKLHGQYDLIYLDPPYLNCKAGGVDYSDFYGFLEGLVDYSLFSAGDQAYAHKPIAKKPSNWLAPDTALHELDAICKKWPRSILFLSYRSDGLPTPESTTEVLRQGGRKVEIHTCGDYKYVLSRTSSNEELFLISLP